MRNVAPLAEAESIELDIMGAVCIARHGCGDVLSSARLGPKFLQTRIVFRFRDRESFRSCAEVVSCTSYVSKVRMSVSGCG